MQFPLKKLNIEFPHEKLCPKLYKAHAPAKAVEIIDNLELKTARETLSSEVVGTGKAFGDFKVTIVLFKRGEYPYVIAEVFTSPERKTVRMCKFAYNPEVKVFYKGSLEETLAGKSNEFTVIRKL